MTVDNKIDAKRQIERLAGKMRRLRYEGGDHAALALEYAYEDAIAWDGTGTAPEIIQDVANFKGITALQARAGIINRRNAIKQVVIRSQKMAFRAKKEISALPVGTTLAELRAVYAKHLALFEAAYDANI